ncbi:MAG TPA: hypothetical protein VFZ76_00005 [Anaerolineales bacterium]
MNSLRALYHMARADYLERTRRYSFLVMLGMVVWLGYATTTGMLVMSVPPNYVGEINSAWAGALMTVTVTMFLGWFGFYLVKGSVSRDYETGVGQIIATTPLSRPLYALGKWLSNFAVLGIMILILMAAGIAMNLLAGEAPVDLWALISPLLLIAVPCMAIVAALAVLFEMIGWLRGGLGNVVYFFMFMMSLIPGIASQSYQPLLDFTGIRLVGDGIIQAAKVAYPESEGGFNFTILSGISAPQRFHYGGIEWSAEVILPRLFFALVAFGLAMLASALFDRFNTSKAPAGGRKGGKAAARQAAVPETAPLTQVHLTPLPSVRRFRFRALYIAELKMLLKGHRWWWYAVSVGLVIAQLAAPHENTPGLLAIAWLWMILLLSGLGNREAQHNTGEMVFSAPRPTLNQVPGLWLAAVTVVALMGSGAMLRYLMDGETARLLAWLGGALFIPSLALAMGAVTLSRKPFEVVYVTWMYIILNEARPLDFVGVVPESPWQVYALLGLGLVAVTVFVRQWQLGRAGLRLGSRGIRGQA